MKFIIGRKLEMTQLFDPSGRVEPVTVIEAGPMTVSQIKSVANDGYDAVQYRLVRGKRQITKECRVTAQEAAVANLGQVVDLSIFAAGDPVAVSGISKGRGFQGVVKRHGFAGGPRTHGQKHSEREPGSIGGGLRSRVPKGMRMAGRMGNDRVTVKNLRVVRVDADSKQIFISGAIPGRRGSLIEIYG